VSDAVENYNLGWRNGTPSRAYYNEVFARFIITKPDPLVEAMAAGLPAASMDVGDVANMVAPENRPFVVCDEQGLAHALGQLAADTELRARLGAANQARAARAAGRAMAVERSAQGRAPQRRSRLANHCSAASNAAWSKAGQRMSVKYSSA